MMNPAEQLPEYEITDAVNEEQKSGIQSHQSFSETEVPVTTGEHIQDLEEGDTPGDAMELLGVVLREAMENQETEAVITCVNEQDEACIALEDELKRRVGRGSIESYRKEEISGRVGFIITLKQEDSLDEAA